MLARGRRVLRPGGRLAVSDVIADPGMDEATRADMQLDGLHRRRPDRAEFARRADRVPASIDVEIRPTHRCTSTPVSAIVRPRKPEP